MAHELLCSHADPHRWVVVEITPETAHKLNVLRAKFDLAQKAAGWEHFKILVTKVIFEPGVPGSATPIFPIYWWSVLKDDEKLAKRLKSNLNNVLRLCNCDPVRDADGTNLRGGWWSFVTGKHPKQLFIRKGTPGCFNLTVEGVEFTSYNGSVLASLPYEHLDRLADKWKPSLPLPTAETKRQQVVVQT